MCNVTLPAAEYRAACVELTDITNELTLVQDKVRDLEERHRKAIMRRNGAERLLLEAAQK